MDADGNNALDELLARRPDLGTLRLTCENTETPLPHIDLVNEILEAIVTSADGKTLSGAAIGETTWDSDLLGRNRSTSKRRRTISCARRCTRSTIALRSVGRGGPPLPRADGHRS